MLSLRKLLYLIATAPLIAFLWLSGSDVIDSFHEYRALESQIVVQRLANTGSRIAQALPAEAFATPGQLAERRAAVDKALEDVNTAFNAWKVAGNADEAIQVAYDTITAKAQLIPAYREHVNAGTAYPNEALFILQPASAAGLELMRRSAATIDSLELSRFIDGYHALMQVNDAGLIEINLGEKFLGAQALEGKEYAFLLHAKELRERFTPQIRENLPKEIVSLFDGFAASEEGKFLAGQRGFMYANQPKPKDQAVLDRWMAQTGASAGMMAGLVAKTGEMLNQKAQEALGQRHADFVARSVITASVLILVLGLCYGVVRRVSGMTSAIENRMRRLAEGDTDNAIPFVGRTDEIGLMARSVEVFRQAAIRNGQLEAEAELSRQQQERERDEVQRLAEAEAEERLNRATGSLAAALRELADGNMICEIQERFAPQFEGLRHDFNTSVAQLRDVLVAVGGSAGAVSGGSGEISHASDNLAKRTEQQAASLEQTTAALEEVTSNVQATSRRTGEARTIVREAKGQAEQSSIVVSNAVSAMQRIENASRQISQIIGVIDEIAFQTNLLALNAGVEAARAGEAGKGFAVVAQEVRELAQRSANAAKEIKGLISNSETAVGEGVKLVNDTGHGLHSIAGLVQSINEHMEAIATAAQEQSTGLAEVNSAMHQMDHATQQNAAMVEEMNAASAGLAEEASRLAAMLSRFRTGVASAVSANPVTRAAKPTPTPQQVRRSAAAPVRSMRAAPAVQSRGNAALAQDNWEEF